MHEPFPIVGNEQGSPEDAEQKGWLLKLGAVNHNAYIDAYRCIKCAILCKSEQSKQIFVFSFSPKYT